MTSEKTTGTTVRLDAGASHEDVVIDSHWASGFEQRRIFSQSRSRSLVEWLGSNEERSRKVAARIGETGVVPEGRRGDDGDNDAELIDVIHIGDAPVGSAVKNTLVFRGWGSRNLYRPDMAGRSHSYAFDSQVAARVFDHRFLEAYDDGREPMFVSYPYVLKPEYRPFLKDILARGWHVTLSPYGNHLRNGSLRLTFSEYDECSEHIADLNAERYALDADGYGLDDIPAVTQDARDFYRVTVAAPQLFAAVLEGLVANSGWFLALSDEGSDPLRPSIHIYFHERTKATAFIRKHLS